jgi:serine/threonine protein kinase
MIRLQRAISYFGTHDSVDGLMTHLGDGDEQAVNRKVLEIIWEGRHDKDIPYRPFAEWKDGGDEVFKDFVGGMLHLDPRKRMTAKKALEHEWWEHADEQARD